MVFKLLFTLKNFRPSALGYDLYNTIEKGKAAESGCGMRYGHWRVFENGEAEVRHLAFVKNGVCFLFLSQVHM